MTLVRRQIIPFTPDLPTDKAFWSEDRVLGVSSFLGTYWASTDEYLRKVEHLNGIHGWALGDRDLSPILEHTELSYLSLGDHCQAVDYSTFPNLSYLGCDWTKGSVLPKETAPLKEFHIWHHPAREFSEFPEWRLLEDLLVVQSSLQTLNGVERSPRLNTVHLAHLRSLRSIGALAQCPALRELHVERCRKIDDIDALRRSSSLQFLLLDHCGDVSSLSWISELASMKELRLVNTFVTDGDVRALSEMDIVYFSRRKNYSHTLADIQEMIAKRKDSQ